MENWHQEDSVKPPIFIVGAPRSGTTLTARIVGSHSRIFMPGETHFFYDIYSRRAQLGVPPSGGCLEAIMTHLSTLYGRYNETIDQHRIDQLFSNKNITDEFWARCKSYRDALSWFMETQMRADGSYRWGNQAPKDIFHIKEILSFYPSAKILVCVRDVRDFLLSYKFKWRATTEEHKNRIKKLYHPVLTSMLWKSSIAQIPEIRELVPSENFMIVRYEDLVANPRHVVMKICECIEEEFEAKMLDIDTHNSSKSVGEAAIFSSSVGRWEKELSQEEAYIGQYLCRREMCTVGYQASAIRVNYFVVAWYFLTLPVGVWRAINANRSRGGPLLPYLMRRISGMGFKT